MTETGFCNKINSEYHTIIRKKTENGKLNFSELINEYRKIIKQLSSMLKYNDSIHSEMPIYQDEIFNQFVNKNRYCLCCLKTKVKSFVV